MDVMNIDDKLSYMAQTASELSYEYLYKLVDEIEEKQKKNSQMNYFGFNKSLYHVN
jgi:hypothetical protein